MKTFTICIRYLENKHPELIVFAIFCYMKTFTGIVSIREYLLYMKWIPHVLLAFAI